MKKIVAFLCYLPAILLAQKDSIVSGAYQWQQPATGKDRISSQVLLEGKVHDFEWMQITANNLRPSQEAMKFRVPVTEEHLIIIKTGILQVKLGDSTYALNPRSVAVLMPGETMLLNSTQPCSYYMMKYRSRSPMNPQRGKQGGGSYVKSWDALPYKPNSNGGGRRDFFERGTAMQKRFEMHVTTLKEGMRSHDPHKHRAEEIVLVIDGDTEMQVGERFYSAAPGGFYFLGSNLLHAIKTTGTKPSTYFAIQFE